MSGWPLVGREHQIDRIMAVLTGSVRGGLVVTGPAGVGKTRLLTECRTRAEAAGAVVNWVFATSSGIPLLPFAHLLPAGAARADLTGVLTAAAAAIEGADALVVDDAHLLDPASTALTRYLVNEHRIPVVLAVRGERSTGWWRDLECVTLTGLTVAEVGELLTAVLGGQVESALPADLATLSKGNPLLLRELVESADFIETSGVWRLSGALLRGTTLPATIAARLDRLTAAVRAAAELVALGEPMEAAVLEDLLGDELLAALEAERLLAALPDRRRRQVVLVHPLYGEALRATLPPLRARDHQRRLADAVEATGARRRLDRFRVAVWRAEAGVPVDAGLLREAAEEAARSLDHELAGRLAQAAVDADGSFESRLVLLTELPYQGDRRRALHAADELVADAGDEAARARALMAKARIHLILGEVPEARQSLGRAVGTTVDPRLRIRLEIVRAAQAYAVGSVGESVTLGDQILHRHPSDPDVVAGLALTQVRALAAAGRTADAVALAARALEMCPEPRADLIRMALLQALAFDGQLDRAVDLGRSRLADVAPAGAVRASIATRRAYWAQELGQASLLAGRPVTARRWLREALAVMPLHGLPASSQLWGLDALSEAEALLGEPARAVATERRLRAALPTGFIAPRRSGAVWARYVQGDVRGALDLARAHAAELERAGSTFMASWVLHDAARLRGADLVVADLRRLATGSQSRLQPLMARHAEALAGGDAVALDEISAEATAGGYLLWAAEAAAIAAHLHRVDGCMGSALASAARQTKLVAACEGARTPNLAPISAILTRREHEVAVLASRGLSDREIAASLHLSVRTVQSHLQRTYRKLRINGRSALPSSLPGAAP